MPGSHCATFPLRVMQHTGARKKTPLLNHRAGIDLESPSLGFPWSRHAANPNAIRDVIMLHIIERSAGSQWTLALPLLPLSSPPHPQESFHTALKAGLYPLCLHHGQWFIEGQGTVICQVSQKASELEREGDLLVQAQRMGTRELPAMPSNQRQGWLRVWELEEEKGMVCKPFCMKGGTEYHGSHLSFSQQLLQNSV